MACLLLDARHIRPLQHICIDSVSWCCTRSACFFCPLSSCSVPLVLTRLLVNVVCVFLHCLFESTLAQLVVVFFSFAQVGVLVMLRCLLSRAMLLLPLSSLCIPTFRVVASSSSRCCLLTLRDFARSCSLAAFSAPLLCLHSRSLAALSGLCRLAIS